MKPMRLMVKWVKENISSVAAISGFAAICAWTLIRLFDRPLNFDLVGQQVLAHQWLHGLHGGTTLGPTNYIIKMLLVYMPFDKLPGSPWLRFTGMTLLINIASFGLLIWLLMKLWRYFGFKRSGPIYVAAFYLALLAGSVYWIGYSNSRNLEVAGGIGLVYLCLVATKAASWRLYAGLTILASFLFFADPLQIYMSLIPALIWLVIDYFVYERRRQKLINIARVILAAVVGIILSRLMVHAVGRLWNATISDPTHPVTSALTPSIKNASKQIAMLYSGGAEAGHFVEATNILMVAAVIVYALRLGWLEAKARRLVIFAAMFWMVDILIFLASGQASQPDTSRYLIMTVPAFLLVFGLVASNLRQNRLAMAGVIFVFILNAVSLAATTVRAWDPGFTKDQHYKLAYLFVEQNNYKYAYAGMNTAPVADYLSAFKANLLPLGCQPDSSLRQASLFFDKASFTVVGSDQQALVPVVFDGQSIVNTPSVCTPKDLQAQIGPAQTTERLADGSQVLIYKNFQLQALKR